jgi:hypothetical protein
MSKKDEMREIVKILTPTCMLYCLNFSVMFGWITYLAFDSLFLAVLCFIINLSLNTLVHFETKTHYLGRLFDAHVEFNNTLASRQMSAQESPTSGEDK